MSRQIPPEVEYIKEKENLIKKLGKNKSPVSSPQAFLLIGQPGSGKSYFVNEVIPKDNTVSINNDDIKLLHPLFDDLVNEKGSQDAMVYVHPYASKMGKDLVKHFTNNKYNVVFESTGKNLDSLVNMVGQFKENNYEVNVIVLATNKEVSKLQVENRYLRGLIENPEVARNVPLEVQEQTIEKLPINIDALYMSGEIDNLQIYTTKYNKLNDEYSYVEIFDNHRSISNPREILNDVIHDLDDRTKELLEQVDKENAELKLELYNKQEYEEDYEEEDDYDM